MAEVQTPSTLHVPTLQYIRIDFHGIVKNVDIEFDQLTVLYGPNGGGKTTIMDAIYRVIRGLRDRRIGSGILGKIHGQGVAKLFIGGEIHAVEWRSTEEILTNGELPEIPIRHVSLLDLLLTDSSKFSTMVVSLATYSTVIFSKFAESLNNLCDVANCFDIRTVSDGVRLVKTPICRGLDCIKYGIDRYTSLGEFIVATLLLYAYDMVADYSSYVRMGVIPIMLIDWPELIHYKLAIRLLGELIKLPLQYIIETRHLYVASYAMKRGAAYYVKDGGAIKITPDILRNPDVFRDEYETLYELGFK